jgi:hypothetical protein
VVEVDNLAPLLRQPVRWGWELWPPPPAQLSPERNNPPRPEEVRLITQAKAAGDKLPAIALVAAWLIVLSVDASLNFQGSVVSVMGVLGAVIAFWAARKAYGNRLLPITIFTVTGLLFAYISLLVEAFFVYRAPNSQQPVVMDPKAVALADRDHSEVVEQWRQRIVAFEEAERQRIAAADLWYPVPVSPATRLVCAFGGSANSWAVALLTLGGSLLGSGKRVLVGNLSRRDSTGPLAKLAEACGLTVQSAEIGSRSAHTLFAGLSWADLTDLLVEVANARQRDADTARKERQLDRAVLREVAHCLDESAPTSIKRLGDALKVIQGRRSSEDFSNEEEDRLTGLYNDVQRQHGDVLERVIRYGLFLGDLEVLDAPAASPNVPDEVAPLQLVSVDRRSQALDNELLVDAVFQLLLHGIRTHSSPSDVLILLGTDRISGQQLEMLSEMATQENLQVFLWFEHLRDEAISLLGAGGAAACFFALTNPNEAAEAVAFIGSGYKWIESQRSRSVSESITKTAGTNTGSSMSFTVSQPMGSSQTSGESSGSSLSEALGSSKEFSSSEQRVKEELLEPQVLMGLPVTCMVYVEVGRGGTRRIANVETNPQLNFADRVAVAPRFAISEASPIGSLYGAPRIE